MRLLRQFQKLMFPHYCLLCGKLLIGDEDRGYPLCPVCENSLPVPGDNRCSHCGRPLISEIGTCMLCRQQTYAFDRLIPLYAYQDEKAGALVRAYKKGKRFSLAQFWTVKIKEILHQDFAGAVIVPIPPRPEKLRTGEQDQVEVLASILEQQGFVIARILARGESIQQKKLNRSMRQESARNAYYIIEMYKNTVPKKIVLIDDVFTTGATLDTCAEILKANGAQWVGATVLAYD